MKRIEVSLVVVVLAVIALLACGCQEEQKVWGQGETPVEYQEYFGNSNTARFDYVQNRTINRNSQVIFDPNGIIVYVAKLDARTKTLEIANPNAKITAFVSLNSEQHKKIGETQIRSVERITALEDRVKKIEDTYIQRYLPSDTDTITVTMPGE